MNVHFLGEFGREAVRFWTKSPQSLQLSAIEVRSTDLTTTIQFFSHDTGGDGKPRSFPCTVVIDRQQHRIDWAQSTAWLLGKERSSTASLGFVLITMVPALIGMPWIATVRATHRMLELQHGMSRDSWALLQALQGQLDSEIGWELREALRNAWKHELRMRRQIDLVEARHLLSDCDLTEYRYEVFADGQRAPTRQERRLQWKQDGDTIAMGHIDAMECNRIRVLGSLFVGDKAISLSFCCRSKRIANEPHRSIP
jgi:hypothetical protein